MGGVHQLQPLLLQVTPGKSTLIKKSWNQYGALRKIPNEDPVLAPPPLQDDYPLASLPLLGYSVTVPSESENIHKDYVFKLHFKSHVYYFRSESEYTFERYGPQTP